LITHRRLTGAEARLMHEELKSTPNILGYVPSELEAFEDVWVSEVDSSLAGVCVSKDLLFGWTDIAVLYVLPAFRGQGLGAALYLAALRRAQERGRHVLTLSRSPEVIRLMERQGMEVTGALLRAPLALHLAMIPHMMNLYRIREAKRKSPQMKGSPPMVVGLLRHSRAGR
jgi:GNAT superfamily N-acetyltransferase